MRKIFWLIAWIGGTLFSPIWAQDHPEVRELDSIARILQNRTARFEKYQETTENKETKLLWIDFKESPNSAWVFRRKFFPDSTVYGEGFARDLYELHGVWKYFNSSGELISIVNHDTREILFGEIPDFYHRVMALKDSVITHWFPGREKEIWISSGNWRTGQKSTNLLEFSQLHAQPERASLYLNWSMEDENASYFLNLEIKMDTVPWKVVPDPPLRYKGFPKITSEKATEIARKHGFEEKGSINFWGPERKYKWEFRKLVGENNSATDWQEAHLEIDAYTGEISQGTYKQSCDHCEDGPGPGLNPDTLPVPDGWWEARVERLRVQLPETYRVSEHYDNHAEYWFTDDQDSIYMTPERNPMAFLPEQIEIFPRKGPFDCEIPYPSSPGPKARKKERNAYEKAMAKFERRCDSIVTAWNDSIDAVEQKFRAAGELTSHFNALFPDGKLNSRPVEFTAKYHQESDQYSWEIFLTIINYIDYSDGIYYFKGKCDTPEEGKKQLDMLARMRFKYLVEED